VTDKFDRRAGMVGLLLCVLCLAYFFLLAAHIAFDYRNFTLIFVTLLIFFDKTAAVVGVLVCLAALLWKRPQPLLRLVDFLDRHARAIAVGGGVAFAAGALLVYKNYPLSMDEYAAAFQSKIFASGHLSAHLPPSLVPWLIPPGFNGFFLVISPETGRGIEAYWPGFALLLAPFQLIGMPWLCNAALAGLAVLLIHKITLEVTGDRRAAGWAMLFALASSAFWANAISYYSMQAHLTANLLYAWLLLKPTNARCFAAGLTGSLALILHNPLPHALFALPWLVAIAMTRDVRPRLLPLAAGYMPGIAVGIGWAWLKGEILPATESAAAVSSTLKEVFVMPDTGLLDMRVAAVVKMWVWALPCLFYFAVLGAMRLRENRHVRLLALSAVVTFVGYLFVKLDQGHGWGYRYFHSAWGVVPILAACAMTRRSENQQGLLSFAGASAVLSLVILVPLQLWQIDRFITQHLAMVPAPHRPDGNVFFIDPRGGYYLGDMIQMDPGLRSKDLLLLSRGRELDTELVQQNWPGASRCGGTVWIDQWCVGAARISVTDGGHFVPSFSAKSPESPAD
jgi:hypothetical protein